MIKLSKMTDYAVVVLGEMARHGDSVMPAASLAEKTGLPEPTVSKLLKTLTKDKIVESMRGVSGGYILRRKAAELSLVEIITAVDGPIALTACVEGSESCCALEKTCSMKGRWSPVNAAMKTALSNVTLADMVA